jgi:membrane associated rhomboid family serine protease
MFPLGDDDSTRRTTPFVTYALIAINVVVFLLELQNGDDFIRQWSFVPARFAADPAGNVVTIFTAMFMHGSWMHLGGNMLYLWIFGDQIEDLLGHVKFLVFYLLCGFAADAAHIFSSADSMIPTLGASGAIAGVLGAYLVKYPRNPIRVLLMRMVTQMPAIVVLGLWFVLQFISQMTMGPGEAGVAYWAHIGGFVAGVLMAFLFRSGGSNPRISA